MWESITAQHKNIKTFLGISVIYKSIKASNNILGNNCKKERNHRKGKPSCIHRHEEAKGVNEQQIRNSLFF